VPINSQGVESDVKRDGDWGTAGEKGFFKTRGVGAHGGGFFVCLAGLAVTAPEEGSIRREEMKVPSTRLGSHERPCGYGRAKERVGTHMGPQCAKNKNETKQLGKNRGFRFSLKSRRNTLFHGCSFNSISNLYKQQKTGEGKVGAVGNIADEPEDE